MVTLKLACPCNLLLHSPQHKPLQLQPTSLLKQRWPQWPTKRRLALQRKLYWTLCWWRKFRFLRFEAEIEIWICFVSTSKMQFHSPLVNTTSPRGHIIRECWRPHIVKSLPHQFEKPVIRLISVNTKIERTGFWPVRLALPIGENVFADDHDDHHCGQK